MPHSQSQKKRAQIEKVPIMSLSIGESPRLNGEDRAHIARLAEADTPLPPILVDRRTMQVIDGMHRLMAASLQGRETIDVEYFDGSPVDVFLHAVQENITHGLPLTRADRMAAAERIIASHSHMSDRGIGHVTGLAAKTVSAIRKSSTGDSPQSNARVGRDGRVRPLDSSEGRRRAAELLTSKPDSSLRDVARAAGISPATVLDVRKRLEQGESPLPGRSPAGGNDTSSTGTGRTTADDRISEQKSRRGRTTPGACSARLSDPAEAVEKLLRDPALRGNEQGKAVLRLLQASAMSEAHLPDAVGVMPPHRVRSIMQLARHYSRVWQKFADELDHRARVIDPSSVGQ